MPYPLLATKFFLPPTRTKTVRRPRLTERLTEGLQRPLSLVSAPAGFGKTTLLSEWRETPAGEAFPLAWLSLDPSDNDPRRFWASVMSALQRLPALAGLPDELDATLPAELLLVPLINGLASAPGPFALVMDDYHVIESAEIHAAVSALVEHMPAGMRMVVLTRSDPPWPLARLRANGCMAELRAADLRFTPGESAEFLTRTMGLTLNEGDLAILDQRTEGWIAALQMAAISLEGHPDPLGFIAAFSGGDRYIADYLAEEVIAQQPEPLGRFLLQISVLERFSAPLCEAVTGSPESRAWLEQMERKNLFLVPLDAMRHMFRFHHLFGELLRTRLEHQEPNLVRELHDRAADWYAGQGLFLEAVEHALIAGSYDRAAQFIERNAEGWWGAGQSVGRDVLLRLPPKASRQYAWHCTFQAWHQCLTGHLEAASAMIDMVGRQPALPDDLRAGLALMRTYIADMTGQPHELTEQIVRSAAYIPEENVAMRSSAELMVASILYMSGRLAEAAVLLTQAAERGMARRAAGAVPTAVARLGRIRLVEGRVAEAAELCRRYLGALEDQGAERLFAKGNLHAVLAEALLLQGELAAAEEHAREAVACNRAWALAHATALALQALARVRFAQGDAAGALDLLQREEYDNRGVTLPPELVSERTALRVQIWLELGDRDAAQRWARESGLRSDDPLSFRRELEHMALVRVLLASGRRAEGAQLASRLAEAAAAGGRLGRLESIRSLMRQEPSPLGEPLTEREREVLALLARGYSNQQMAAALFVATGTVKAHVHQILLKLDAESRTRAVAKAREFGLLK